MQKNVAFYSNAVANIFKNGYIVTLIVEVCHAMIALIFFFFKGCLMWTPRLELQLSFAFFFPFQDEVTDEAMPFMIVMKDK